jgi:hypothetical protein
MLKLEQLYVISDQISLTILGNPDELILTHLVAATNLLYYIALLYSVAPFVEC